MKSTVFPIDGRYKCMDGIIAAEALKVALENIRFSLKMWIIFKIVLSLMSNFDVVLMS